MVRPWTLRIVHAKESFIGNCVCLIESEPVEFQINNDMSHFFIGIQLLLIGTLFVEIRFLPA